MLYWEEVEKNEFLSSSWSKVCQEIITKAVNILYIWEANIQVQMSFGKWIFEPAIYKQFHELKAKEQK